MHKIQSHGQEKLAVDCLPAAPGHHAVLGLGIFQPSLSRPAWLSSLPLQRSAESSSQLPARPVKSESGLLRLLQNTGPNRARAGQKGSLADSSASLYLGQARLYLPAFLSG